MLESNETKKKLRLSQRVAYGVGHVMNDIASAMWFSYTLLFFEVVLKIPSMMAGGLIFLGQLADAIASPIVGALIDRNATKKFWHMLGTAFIGFSFPLIFSKCPWGPEVDSGDSNGTEFSSWDKASVTELSLGTFGYGILVILFQTGWATVQIAHLAIITDTTPDKCERADLTAIRYTATVASSIFVYLVTWFVLHVTDGNTSALGPEDAYKFKDIVLVGIFTGGIFTIWFHAVLDAKNDSNNGSISTPTTSEPWFLVIKKYFASWPLYQVTLLYFSSRMILNISLVYMPMFLVELVADNAELIAIIPLVSYLASFLGSIAVKQARSFCDSKVSYLIGILLSIGACVWIGTGLFYTGELYGISILLGAGSTITSVASLCLCADLIGTNTENGAFIYSVVTAVDKLLGGIVVVIIEHCKEEIALSSSHYYRDVLAYGCGISSILGLVIVTSMFVQGRKVLENQITEKPKEPELFQ